MLSGIDVGVIEWNSAWQRALSVPVTQVVVWCVQQVRQVTVLTWSDYHSL